MPTKVSIDGNDSPAKRAPRKRAVRRVVSTSEVPVRRTKAAVTTLRKAPTNVEYVEKKKASSKSYLYVILAFVLVLGGAAWLGFSDKGQINVNAKITERNQKLANDATASNNEATGENNPQTIVIPVQNSSPTIPNGGFRGQGLGTGVVNQAPVVEESASSTEAVEGEATSTEAVAEAATENQETPTEPSSEVLESGAPELAQ